MRLTILLFMVVFVCGCGQSLKQSSHFDTLAFFEQEIARLNTSKCGLRKVMKLSNNTDSIITTTNIKWDDELHIFKQTDLRKPVYHLTLKCDTTANDSQIILNYSATESSLELRNVQICMDLNNRVKWINILKEKHDMLHHSAEQLRYQTGKWFTIKGTQSVRGGETITYNIAAEITYE